MVPYFVFAMTYFGTHLLLGKEKSINPLLHLLWVNAEELPIAGALWFLTALFLTNVMHFCIDRFITNEIGKWFGVIVISLFGCEVGTILPFTLPYGLGASIVGVGLFHLGYMLHKGESVKIISFLLHMRWIQWIIGVDFVTVLIFTNGYVNMSTGVYSVIPLFWIML